MTHQGSFEFEGIIWKIHIDAHTDHVALELRDAQEWNTSFAWADLKNNTLHWKNFSLDENWWLAMVGVHNQMILLHKFPKAERPEPSGILALNAQNKSVQWHLPNHQIQDWQGEQLIALHKQANQEVVYQSIDLYSGKINYLNDQYTRPEHQESTEFRYPQQYQQGTAYFDTVANFLADILKHKILQTVDYLEFKNFIIINYFFQENKNIQNNLLILDSNVRILLHEELIAQSQGIGLDSFFMYKDYLLFIKNKSQLEIFQL